MYLTTWKPSNSGEYRRVRKYSTKLTEGHQSQDKTDDDKLTYEMNMIEYKALMDLHRFNMQLEKDGKNGKPKRATMTFPANKMYKTAGIKTTKNY